MMAFFNTPATQVLFLPFLGAILLTGLLRLVGGTGSGINLANAAVGAAFAWVCALVLGTPNFPPPFNSNGILSASVSLLAIGIVLDLWLSETTKFGRLIETTTIILAGIGITAWMRGGIDVWSMPALLAWGAVLFSLQRVGTAPEFGTGNGTLLLALAASGLGLIAWISDIIVDRDLAFGLAAAGMGFYIWNWPAARLFFGRGILLSGGGGLCMIALRLIEQAPPLIPALILLGFIFFTDNAVRYFPAGAKLTRQLPNSIKFITLAIIPVILAVLAALIAIEFTANSS